MVLQRIRRSVGGLQTPGAGLATGALAATSKGVSDPAPFDRDAVRRHRIRAEARLDRVAPILDEAAARLVDRLDDMTRRFEHALDLGGRRSVAPLLRARGIETTCLDLARARDPAAPGLTAIGDEERLPFAEGAFDLVVASLSLHWVNDLPGALIQIRRCLRPDGLFLASLPVLDTLGPLRRALFEAESALRDGVSPRVSPFPELRDCAGLLQRAGFALPVADLETIALEYGDGLALLRDLRDAGESNAIRLRDRRIPPRALIPLALARLSADPAAARPDGRIAMPLRMAVMTAWSPSPAQPRALAPGQFATPLADVLERP